MYVRVILSLSGAFWGLARFSHALAPPADYPLSGCEVHTIKVGMATPPRHAPRARRCSRSRVA
eukprot:3375589-Prymnesium_polylepis.1